MIEFAKEGMLPRLYEIWQEAFEDEKAYIDSFFRCFDVETTVMVYTDEKGEPVSMLSVLPAFFACPGKDREENRKAAYLYGVATAKEFRGQGYSSSLLQYTAKKLLLEDTVPFLSPARQELVPFYERIGFVAASSESISKISDYGNQKRAYHGGHPVCADILPEEYERLRNRAFSQKVRYLRWPLETLTYAQQENAFWGGRMQKIRFREKDYGVLYRIAGQKLLIREITEADEQTACLIGEALLASMPHIHTAELQRTMSAMIFGRAAQAEAWMNLSMG